ncbi:MAG TPA: BatD family protein, partial [Bacteroidia bacterium]|nr:BatD family protein [Bacteroidia bacterium]
SKNKVVTGEVFQVSFTVNGNMSGFKAPSFADFDVYSGPNQSTSMQIANGNMSQTVSYSYMIAARKEGKFTIGAASCVINGAKSESNPITIEVAKGDPKQQQQQRQQQQQNPFGGFFGQEENQPQQSQGVSAEDLFIRTYVNKKQCYLGEQIIVTQKIYARTNITHRGMQNGKLPSFDGFWSKAEEKKGNLPINTENLDGVQYGVVELSQTYLFPQRTGKLTIDPIELDWVVRTKPKRQQSIFDQFFGGGGQDVVVKLKSKPVTVDVQPLPEAGKPDNFTGAVGNFSFNAKLNHDKVKANEGLNLKLTITGKGNISLVSTPKINFPDGFETYDPKVNETVSTAGGVSGTKTYDYLVIPRKAGEFTLKDINFSYFDVEKKKYITLPSPEIKITVDAADPNSVGSAQVYNPKHEIQTEENDIRYIKTGNLNLHAADEEFFSSWKHFSLLGLITALFVGFLVVRTNYLKSQSDVVGVKQKRAIKIARKQLALAEKFKNENKQTEFYNEVHTALNNYLSHKLNIPVADLSKDTITDNLMKKHVSAETISTLITTLNDCEYARYAPAAAEKDLNLVYNNTIDLITKIENELAQQSKNASSKIKTVALFFCLLSCTSIFGINVQDSAAAAYNHKEYKKAINYYEIVLREGNTSAALHYNLANAYFKDNQLGKAIYNYELAKKLNPADDDIKNNLRIANSKVVDKIDAKENFFANTIKTGLYSLFSSTGWAYVTIICLLLAALFFILFSVTGNVVLKRVGFWTGSVFIIGFVFAMVIGYAALHELHKNTQAVIISQEVAVLPEPNATAKTKFNLHEGTKVNVLSVNGDYTAIQLANGNEGFIATKDLGLF